jgi:hypothetical protein
LFADPQAGVRFVAPRAADPVEDLFVEPPDVGDRVVNGGDERWVERCDRLLDFVGGDGELVGSQRDVVEVVQRTAHRFVAMVADIVDDPPDRLTQRRVEDGAGAAFGERPASFVVHLGPSLHTHHGNDARRVGWRCLRPRQDSNLRTRLRRPMLYPLSYEGGMPPP